MSEHPEVNKFSAIHEDFGTIIEFMEWAAEQGYHFTKTVMFTETGIRMFNGMEYEYEVPREVPVRADDAVYDFFEIDQVKLARERQAILTEFQTHNEQHRDTYTVHPAPEEDATA